MKRLIQNNFKFYSYVILSLAIMLMFVGGNNVKANMLENDDNSILLQDGTEIEDTEIINEDNLVKKETFYLNDENGKVEEFEQKVYEITLPNSRLRTANANAETKVALAVVRANTISDSEYDSTSTYKFYGEVTYNRSTLSSGQTAYSLTSVYGNASTSESRVSLSNYHVVIGQSGVSESGAKTQIAEVYMGSNRTFNIVTDYEWVPVSLAWGDIQGAVGQTQHYTLTRGGSSWSGSFTLNI